MKVVLSSDNDNSDDDNNSDNESTSRKRRNKSGKKQYPTTNIIDSSNISRPMVPTTMFAKFSDGKPITTDPPVVAEHRAIFMKCAFGMGNKSNEEAANQKQAANKKKAHKKCESSLRHEHKLDHVCYILKHWGGGCQFEGDDDDDDDDICRKQLAKFQREHAIGKHHVSKYNYEESHYPVVRSKTFFAVRRIEFGKVGRIVVSRERISDAINEWHRGGSGHFGLERTYTSCSQKYWNCTQAHVCLFCELCPECCQKNPAVKAMKGSRKPIKSRLFGDRFQIDLIDMHKLCKRNPYGVLMRWIVTIKDHATGYTMIDCIPCKTAQFVAHVLQSFVGHIGYPFIFHTDNGKWKGVHLKGNTEVLVDYQSKILTVTGWPYHVIKDQLNL